MIRRTKVLPQNVEALRAGASESNSFDFHELRQGFIPHRFIVEQRTIVGRLEALEELRRSALQKAFAGSL